MATFSTLGIPVSRKVAYWNEISSESFALMEVRPNDIADFDGTLRRDRIGPVTLMDVSSSAVTIRHSRAHIAATSAPTYLLLTPLQGDLRLTVEQGPSIHVQSGEYCLIDHARRYELKHGAGVRTLCLDVPRLYLEQRVPNISAVVGRLMRPDKALSRMLIGLLRTLGDEATLDGVGALPPEFGQTLLELVTATYAASLGPPPLRGAKARASAYRAHIASRLGEGDLTPAAVAAHFGISERYLRAVLRADGESFSVNLLRARLARCAEELAKPAALTRTITEIAFDAGFNDATHFGQAFKRRFGMTPTAYRRRATHSEISE
jgi:AraC-like DNA-binding protein